MNEQPGLFSLDDDPGPLNPTLRRPQEPIVREALIVGDCRLWLKRAWGAGPMVTWAMCNPSKAGAALDDPTMWRVMEFSMACGFGSCAVVNPVPLISPNPADALDWIERLWSDKPGVGNKERGEFFANVTECHRLLMAADTRIAAWGNNLPSAYVREWFQAIVMREPEPWDGDEEAAPFQWMCLGTTISGAPKHPLARGKHRIPPGFKPIPWKQP